MTVRIPPGYVAVDKPTVSNHGYPELFLGLDEDEQDFGAGFFFASAPAVTWLDFADRARLKAELELAARMIEALSKEPRNSMTVPEFLESMKLLEKNEALQARVDELEVALGHQVYRTHGYSPDGCSACDASRATLARKVTP